MSSDYFGSPDAAEESLDTLALQHLVRSYESDVKAYDRTSGQAVIVGIKGSGKTDLRRYIEASDQAVFFNLDVDNTYLSIDAAEHDQRSGQLKNALALLILQAFVDRIVERVGEDQIQDRLKGGLRRAFEKGSDVLKNLPQAIDVETPLGSLNLGALLRTDAVPWVQSAWKTAYQELVEALEGERAYIMIDDAEDVFPGLEENADFIEGLARAVHDINRDSRARIHALLFLKYGVWRYWYENQREYDKVRHTVLILTWDHDSLCELIARRIARIHGHPDRDLSKAAVSALWEYEFEWEGEFDSFARSITRYCVSGARDMIVLCNKAKEAAGEDKIHPYHISQVIKQYSEEKLYGVNADFGDIYPGIHTFIENVFQSAPPTMSGRDVAEWIEREGMLDERVDSEYRQYTWYSRSGKQRLAAIMYDIGVLGRQLGPDNCEYAIEQPNVSQGTLRDSTLVFHPAFRPHLGIEDDLD